MPPVPLPSCGHNSKERQISGYFEDPLNKAFQALPCFVSLGKFSFHCIICVGGSILMFPAEGWGFNEYIIC